MHGVVSEGRIGREGAVELNDVSYGSVSPGKYRRPYNFRSTFLFQCVCVCVCVSLQHRVLNFYQLKIRALSVKTMSRFLVRRLRNGDKGQGQQIDIRKKSAIPLYFSVGVYKRCTLDTWLTRSYLFTSVVRKMPAVQLFRNPFDGYCYET